MAANLVAHARRALILAIAAAILAGPGPRPAAAAEAAALELVLAIDTSASVDPEEFHLQARGLANAFRDEEVLQALGTTLPLGTAVMLMQWAGPYAQDVSVPWRLLRSRADALAFADEIEAMTRVFLVDVTAIGEAVDRATVLILENDYVAPRMVIDVSGDGPSNFGTAPDVARDRAVAAGITINGLVILNGQLVTYEHYLNFVIGGNAAFVQTAEDFVAYATAIRTKLIREITGSPYAEAPGRPSTAHLRSERSGRSAD